MQSKSKKKKKRKRNNHFILILRTFYAESTYFQNFVYSHDNDVYVEDINVNVY